MAAGDLSMAKKSIMTMGRLSRGMESDDENTETPPKSGRGSEPVIVKSGKRFAVRKTIGGQLTDVGRYFTIINIALL